MTLSRVYYAEGFNSSEIIELTNQAHLHLSRVLRKKVGECIILFDGKGHSIMAEIIQIDKRQTTLKLQNKQVNTPKMGLSITLGQVIAKGDKMDFVIQKATELGVDCIYPLRSERCDVRLDSKREEKRLQHWKNIAISACEQSGRDWLPEIHPISEFNSFCESATQASKFIMHPMDVNSKDAASQNSKSTDIALLVGPEGGFSKQEITRAIKSEFIGIRLGSNILRTETAALAAISALQFKYGYWQF